MERKGDLCDMSPAELSVRLDELQEMAKKHQERAAIQGRYVTRCLDPVSPDLDVQTLFVPESGQPGRYVTREPCFHHAHLCSDYT